MAKKTIIISGATSMIGQAVSQYLSVNDNQLILIGRTLSKLKHLAKSLSGTAKCYAVDIRQQSDILNVMSEVIHYYKKIDILISNTASYPQSSIEDTSLGDWEHVISTTLTAPFLLSQQCIPVMKRQCAGKIILLSSIAGEVIGLPNMASYAAAKAGLNGFMRSASIELAKYGIQVNAISPGKMYDSAGLSDTKLQEKIAPIPLKRLIRPEDIAEMVCYLASSKADNITGQNFIIDGGQTIVGEQAHLV